VNIINVIPALCPRGLDRRGAGGGRRGRGGLCGGWKGLAKKERRRKE